MNDAVTRVACGPAYPRLLDSGELRERVARAREYLHACVLCARRCRVDRHAPEGRRGACRTGAKAVIVTYGPHYGEEPPLRGLRGSGAIFFGSCNLRCSFCQNWEIREQRGGREVESDELARIMLELQGRGCHNVNLVSPSHMVAPILEAVEIAAGLGLRLPIVYNTGGYDSPEALELLDGVIDIYMPDMKFADSGIARRYCHVRNYGSVNRAAVREMHRQVGDLVLDENGVALRGLLVRHLVLPGGLAGTGQVMKFLAHEVSRNTYVNLMDQYHPADRAVGDPVLGRRPTTDEFHRARDLAVKYGIMRLDPGSYLLR